MTWPDLEKAPLPALTLTDFEQESGVTLKTKPQHPGSRLRGEIHPMHLASVTHTINKDLQKPTAC